MAVRQRSKTASKATKAIKGSARETLSAAVVHPSPACSCGADEERRRIELKAYFLAEQRGFGPGGELDDWLRAEAEVRGENRQ
jgi:hypothetical protein